MELGFITGFFAALVWWEIGLFAIALIVGGFSLNNEGGALFTAAIGVLLFYFFGVDFNLINIGIYLAAGMAWFVFKFRNHVRNVIDECKEADSEYTKSDVKYKIFRDIDADVVFFWIVAWPFSLIGFFINDFAVYVYKRLRGMMGNIVDNMIAKAGFKD